MRIQGPNARRSAFFANTGHRTLLLPDDQICTPCVSGHVAPVGVTTSEAIDFVRTHGVVLESAAGPVPSLAAAIAGEPIRGSWWAHARGREIFTLTRAVRECPDVLVCRLIDGKITYVHQRLWAALVRVSKRFPPKHLARVHETHTAAGKHVNEAVPFGKWLSHDLAAQAALLDEHRALDELGFLAR
jgi:hypothetical protein